MIFPEKETYNQLVKNEVNKTQLSIPEAMVQEAQILDQGERNAAKLNDERQRELTRINDQFEGALAKDAHELQQLQFQAGMRQCDQHHELEMFRQQAILNQGQAVIAQWKEILHRLRASIHCQINQTFTLNHRLLSGGNPNSDIDLDDLHEEE